MFGKNSNVLGAQYADDDSIYDYAANPNWESVKEPNPEDWHNWRRQVPEEIRLIWHTFHKYHQVALMLWADELCFKEKYDHVKNTDIA